MKRRDQIHLLRQVIRDQAQHIAQLQAQLDLLGAADWPEPLRKHLAELAVERMSER